MQLKYGPESKTFARQKSNSVENSKYFLHICLFTIYLSFISAQRSQNEWMIEWDKQANYLRIIASLDKFQSKSLHPAIKSSTKKKQINKKCVSTNRIFSNNLFYCCFFWMKKKMQAKKSNSNATAAMKKNSGFDWIGKLRAATTTS